MTPDAVTPGPDVPSAEPTVLRHRLKLVLMNVAAVLFVGAGIGGFAVGGGSASLGGALFVGYGLWTAYEAWATGVRPRGSALAVHTPYHRTRLVPGPGRVEVQDHEASSGRSALCPVVVFDDGRAPVALELLGRTAQRGADQARHDQVVLQRWLDAA